MVKYVGFGVASRVKHYIDKCKYSTNFNSVISDHAFSNALKLGSWNSVSVAGVSSVVWLALGCRNRKISENQFAKEQTVFPIVSLRIFPTKPFNDHKSWKSTSDNSGGQLKKCHSCQVMRGLLDTRIISPFASNYKSGFKMIYIPNLLFCGTGMPIRLAAPNNAAIVRRCFGARTLEFPEVLVQEIIHMCFT